MLKVAKCYERQCKHYQGVQDIELEEDIPEEFLDGDIGQEHVCAAFPNGIPYNISYGNDLHMKVHPDQDNKIVYEKKG
jgi:hypothetical protein